MPEEITSSVAAIEAESEKMLEEARDKARAIVLEAKEEAKKILSSQLPLDEVKAECVNIVNQAKAEADKKIEDSEKTATGMRANAEKRAREITDRIVSIVTGKS